MEKEESKSDKIYVKDLCLIIKHPGSWEKFTKKLVYQKKKKGDKEEKLVELGNLNLLNFSKGRDSFYQAEANELIGEKLATAREIKGLNNFFQKWCGEEIFEEVGNNEYRLRIFAAIGPSETEPIFFFSNDDPEYSEYFKNLAIKRGVAAEIIRNLDLHLTRTAHLEISEKELDRIKKIYVPPLNYERARKILKDKKFLIIIGPPHTGKTTTAIHLLLELKEELAVDKILKCSTYEDFETIDDSSSNTLILLDDPFGGSMYERGDIVNIITEELMPVSEKNYIILTSRKQVFDVAKRKTKLGERYINDNLIELKQEGSYSDKNLKEILKKHMLYAKEKLSAEQIQLVELNENIIISELRFPHNIERFVDVHLKDAHNEESLHLAVEKAKEIKAAAKSWFLNLDENVKIALIITWLLPNQIRVNEFSIIYWATCKELKNFHVSTQPFGIDILKNEVSLYVDISEEINFRHSSYEEGITEGILDHYFDTVFSILKIFINTDMPLEWNCQLTPKCNLVQTGVVKESAKELKHKYEESEKKSKRIEKMRKNRRLPLLMFYFEFEEILSKKISGKASKWQIWSYTDSLRQLVFLFSYFSLGIVHTEEIKNKNELNKMVNGLYRGIDIIAEEYKCKYKNNMICLEKVRLINMLRNAGTANIMRIAKIRRDYGRKMLGELWWTDTIYYDAANELAHILK